MTLDNNYTITRDSYNVILNFREKGDINPKTGKPIVRTNEWYYKNLEDALIAYTEKVMSYSNDVQNVLNELKTTRQHIASLLRESAVELK